jgi:hypothetical protein
MSAWHAMGWPARISLIICLAPLIAAAVYALGPTARRLALTRSLSLAALSAGLGATISGCAALLRNIGSRPELGSADWPWIAVGLSERLVTTSTALGCLTIAWLLVAVGTGRRSVDRGD